MRERAGRGAMCLAAATVLAWLVILLAFKPSYIADEWRHFLVIQSLTRDEWPPAGYLPMLPAYHLLAAGVCKVFGCTLTVVRVLNAVLALLALLLADATIRLRRPESRGGSTLLLAWNPLLLPYLVLAYTEIATLLALLVALYLHVRGRWRWSAAALLCACLLRQSSVVWVAFFAAWAALQTLDQGGLSRLRPWRLATESLQRRLAPRLWGHVLLIGAAAALFAMYPAFAAGSEIGNRAAVNRAQFYMFGLTAALLWAPVWIEQLARAWPARLAPRLAWAWVCALLLTAVGLLELAFDNPHPWNADPHYLRNLPLLWMTTSRPARLLVGALLVSTVVLAATFFAAQTNRRELALVWAFSLLFVAPHWLVDPRYYIVPTVFVNLFTPWTRGQAWRLAPWFLALSIILCGYILARGSPDGGVL